MATTRSPFVRLPVRLRHRRSPCGKGIGVEREFFGDFLIVGEEAEYEDYLQSIAHCLARQPAGWNPYKPPTVLGFKLWYWVAKHFSRRGQRRLGFYRAVDSSLDWWHGVDGLFYYGSPDDPDWFNQQRWVTIDVADYDKHRQGERVKANLLITLQNFEFKELKRIGASIASYLKGEITLQQMQSAAHRWVEPV